MMITMAFSAAASCPCHVLARRRGSYVTANFRSAHQKNHLSLLSDWEIIQELNRKFVFPLNKRSLTTRGQQSDVSGVNYEWMNPDKPPVLCALRCGVMEGDCLSCMKYLMFIFNFFIFVSSFYYESLCAP